MIIEHYEVLIKQALYMYKTATCLSLAIYSLCYFNIMICQTMPSFISGRFSAHTHTVLVSSKSLEPPPFFSFLLNSLQ